MEIRRLYDEKQIVQTNETSRRDQETRVDEMMAFLEDLSYDLTIYDEDYVKKLAKK